MLPLRLFVVAPLLATAFSPTVTAQASTVTDAAKPLGPQSEGRPVTVGGAMQYPDRFVWVFGWNLNKGSDTASISQVLDAAGQHGLNGAVVSFGLDTLCMKSPDFFRRLDEVKQACERNKLELIPAIFSVGYGGGILSHDRNLAEEELALCGQCR